jgi:hypothetical protein
VLHRETRSGTVLIGQPAHAWVSGQLARAWAEPFEPREEVCLAADQHDIAWTMWERVPELDPETGLPYTFSALPRLRRLELWSGAATLLVPQSRYAALLVSLHGTSLYERVDADAHPPGLAAQIRAYTREERALQATLSAGLDAEEVDRNRRLILALDRFSLALCHGAETTLADVPAAGGGSAAIRVQPVAASVGTAVPPTAAPGSARAADAAGVRDDAAVPVDTATVAYTVAPWPFAAERVVVGCEARQLPGQFGSGDDLAAALAEAPWVPLRWALSPG